MTTTPVRDDIWQRLQSIKSLHTQPAVIAKVSRMLQNPATNADELGQVIRTDPVLASAVLKIVNSAFYGLSGRIGSINHAVVLLGFSTVKNVVFTASMLEMFNKADSIPNKFNADGFWKHSLACGVTAQYLAQITGYEMKEECFVAGLVHDIGKIVMLQLMPEDFMHVVDSAYDNRTLFYDSECELLGINHQEIGGVLIKQWQLPAHIHNAVSYHHTPSTSTGDPKFAAIIHCADIFARALGYGNSGDGKIPLINDVAWEMLRLDSVDLAHLFENIEIEWDKASAYFQLA